MTGHWRPFHPSEIAEHIELRTLYDGWSVLRLKDGSWINRWADPAFRSPQKGLRSPTMQHRWETVEAWIEREKNSAQDEQPGATFLPRHPFTA